ncbi:MAG: PKD domain-containing protein [bacterium]|nr:PKD domain-containing protein [bacterium]
MKTNVRISIYLCLFMIMLLPAAKTQICQAKFSYTLGPVGQVNFLSTSTGTTGTTSYTWNFSTPNPPPVSGVGTVAVFQNVTFTAAGTYTVALGISNASLGCSSSTTQLVIVTPSCSINFSTSPAASSVLCSGSATASALGFCGPVTYSWFPSGTGAAQYSLCTGNHTVFVSGTTSTGLCCPTTSAVVTVPLFSCALNAGFTQTISPSSGIVNFASTTSGTASSSTYTWNYGDASANGAGVTSTHTYSTSGTYSVKLIVNNNSFPSCTDTIIQPISVNVATCNLVANFVYSVAASTSMYYKNTCTGTLSTSSYSWNFGDGSTAFGPSTTHSYSIPGTYTVTLNATNNATPFCTSAKSLAVQVPSVICNISSAFNHTVGLNGVVTFSSNYSGTQANHFWNFGDGYSAIIPAPTHTYTNAGTHYVKLTVTDTAYYFCKDSVIQSINITGVPCVANSVFTLVPTGTPKFWNAIPNYPYNISTAVWSWGDGSTSNGLYTSHVYSVSGTYTICLSTTVSCGASSSYCFPYAISKPAGGGSGSDVYSINVVAPALSVNIQQFANEELEFNIFPNPSSGLFTLKLNRNEGSACTVTIYDLCGKSEFHSVFLGETEQKIEGVDMQNGLHFIQVIQGNKSATKKLLIIK